MKEKKAFKDFRKALNESEYSEVLTGYGNRSAHKDDAGLHHLQSAGALAGINAMLATIGKGTYLDPNEAFLKMKVRLNVVQLDFAWKPGSWDGGVGSFDIPVVQFGRVDGYDAQTGQIRFDGKANPTGGYTELNLHVDVELTPESLYVVTAKLSPSVPVEEEVEVAEGWKSLKKTKADLNAIRASGKRVSVQHGEGDTLYRVSKAKKAVKEEAEVTEDYQTPAREKEMERKVQKHEDIAQRGYSARMTKTGKAAKRGEKLETKHDAASLRLLKRSQKEADSPRTYGRGGKLINRGSRAEVKEGVEAIEEMYKVGDTVKVPHKGKMVKGKIVRHDKGGSGKAAQHGGGYVVDVGEYSSITVPSHKVVKEDVERIDELSKATKDAYVAKRGSQLSSMLSGHKRGKQLTGKQQANAVKGIKQAMGVKEAAEQIDEAGQAKLERLGKAYDKARLGSRGVLNPENKKKLGDAYFKMREKVLDKRKKRIEKGTFDKEKEVQARVAHNKKNYGKGVFGHVFGKKTVKEELVGGQKKLDVNKNKRLDSQDFALLRAKKTILTQKVQDGKKVGLPRPIAKYEGK